MEKKYVTLAWVDLILFAIPLGVVQWTVPVSGSGDAAYFIWCSLSCAIATFFALLARGLSPRLYGDQSDDAVSDGYSPTRLGIVVLIVVNALFIPGWFWLGGIASESQVWVRVLLHAAVSLGLLVGARFLGLGVLWSMYESNSRSAGTPFIGSTLDQRWRPEYYARDVTTAVRALRRCGLTSASS